MKIQVKQFAKKKIEALVKKDMQEWPPGCAGWIGKDVLLYGNRFNMNVFMI